jgi:RimJ/RimL family protein N-acetyltransferase
MDTRRIILKDGRSALIRPAAPEDALPLHECNRAVVAAGLGVVRTVEELDRRTPEKIAQEHREWTHGVHSGPGGCMLVGEVGGAIAGAGTIRRHTPALLRHVAHIGLGIHPAWQGLGLGRALMEGLLAWARAGPEGRITRIELSVIADNHRAIALYESLGFRHEGVRRAHIRFPDGRYADDLLMALLTDDPER